MKLEEALLSLDHANDDHWTQDGLPRIDVLNNMVGEKLTRQQVTDIDPTFIRESHRAADDDAVETKSDASSDAGDVATVNTPPAVEADDVVDDESTVLREKERELQDRVTGLNRAISLARQEILLVEAELTTVQERLQALIPKETTMESIQAYIARQHELRVQRMTRRQAVESQVDLASIKVKAPIDEAMSRKNTRGAARPVRQVTQS